MLIRLTEEKMPSVFNRRIRVIAGQIARTWFLRETETCFYLKRKV